MKFRVFPVDDDYLRDMKDDESVCDVLDTDDADVHWEIFLHEGEDRVKYTLYHGKKAYYDKENTPLNQCFENYVREKAPYAPQFRGNLVLIDLEKHDFTEFVEACKAKWGEKPKPDDDIPIGLLESFSRLREQQGDLLSEHKKKMLTAKK